jgi:hypothetical protein
MKRDGYSHISEVIGADLENIEVEKTEAPSETKDKLQTKIEKRKEFKERLYSI